MNALHIDLGVQLTAWQKDAEKDSFDETYDAVVHSEAQLAEALQNGGNIKVGSNIELTEMIVIPEGVTATLNLNGNNIAAGLDPPRTDGGHLYAFTNNGTLIIDGEGTISSRGIYNYGTMTLNNGTLEAVDGNGGYGVRSYKGAAFVMNGGKGATTWKMIIRAIRAAMMRLR